MLTEEQVNKIGEWTKDNIDEWMILEYWKGDNILKEMAEALCGYLVYCAEHYRVDLDNPQSRNALLVIAFMLGLRAEQDKLIHSI